MKSTKPITLSRELCPETIDEFSNLTRQFLEAQKQPRRDVMRYVLTLEEILNNSRSAHGDGTNIRLRLSRRFFRPQIVLSIVGASRNLYVNHSADAGLLGESLLKTLGLTPEYSYRGNENTYTFTVRRKRLNPFITLALTLIAALVVSLSGFLMPETWRAELMNGLLTPLHDTFLNILSCVASPMIFLSVAWGIYGIGDAATLKRVGKRILLNYVILIYLAVLLIGSLCVLLFRVDIVNTGSGISSFSDIFTMLLGIFPSDIFSPFVNGNTLQIIFLAVVFGIAMLFLGEKTSAVARAVEQINLIMQFLIEFISRIVPYFVFIMLVDLAWSEMNRVFSNIGDLLAIFLFGVIILLVCTVMWCSIRVRVHPFSLVRKGFPTFLIGVTTASSAAAFSYNVSTSTKEYGIDESLASFGLPLGVVTFKPSSALNFLCQALFFAKIYNVEITMSWIVLMMFTVGILALATPPIPGGAMASYAVLYAQLGIPAEALALSLAIDTLIDFVCTGTDQFLIPVSLLVQASKLGMVDRTKLLKKK